MDTAVILLLVAAAVALVVVVVRYLRSRQAERTEAARSRPRRDPLADVHGNEDYLRRLKVGDVVRYEASDYLVRGSLRFDEEGYTWAEHLIGDGETQHWLSVEDDEGISVVLWQRVGLAQLTGEPGAPTVGHAGVAYQLHEQGQASYTAEGTTGTAPSGTLRYVDYRGPDGQRLSCEQLGRSWEVSVGRTVTPRSVDVYPVNG